MVTDNDAKLNALVGLPHRVQNMARRDFLQKVSAGAALGVAATALVGKAAKAKPETIDERKRTRYKESDHVKSFYDTCKF